MPRKLTLDEINLVLNPRGFKLLGEYKNGSTKTLFGCSNGHTWEARFQDIKNSNSGCPICAGTMRKTPEQINIALSGRGIQLVGDYVNNKTKATFQCSNGHQWDSRPDNVVTRGSGCPHCSYSRLSESKVYIMSSSTGIKIGISTSPEIRCRKIQTESGILDLHVVKVFEVDTYERALEVEAKIHRLLAEYKVLDLPAFSGYTEFFCISEEKAINKVQEVLRNE